jgi:hypothetical protein
MQTSFPNPEPGAHLGPGVCPRCGANVGQSNSPYCPSCGALLQQAPKSTSVVKIIVAVFLGMAALGSAGVGACLLLLGGMGMAGGDGAGMIGVAIGFLVVALLMLAGMIALILKR